MKVCVCCLLLLPLLAVGAYADILGTASSFAVLGATTVTNTGATTLGGNLGVSPGSSITGSGTITLTGSIYTPPSLADGAQADALTAYNILKDLVVPAPIDLSGSDLGSFLLPLTPGVYKFDTSAQLTGALTLNFTGDNQKFVFQIGTTLITGSGASVSIINAGSNDNVYWQVGSSATLGTSTSFMGDIIALQSVSMDTTAKDGCGSVIALHGAVTLDTNTISNTCTVAGTTTGTPGIPGTFGGTFTGTGNAVPTTTGTILAGPTTVVPEPGTWLLLGSIIAVLAAQRRWARAKV